MAKFPGLAITMSIDNTSGTPVAITNDVGTITLNTTIGEQDVTGLDKSAMERLQLLEDTDITIGGNGLPSAGTRAVLFENLRTTRTLTFGFPDSADGTIEVFLYSYNISRGQDGGISWTANAKLNNGTALAWS